MQFGPALRRRKSILPAVDSLNDHREYPLIPMDIQRMLFEAVQSKSNTDNQLMDLCPIILGLKSRLIEVKRKG